jgi:hypothetical protein
MNCDISSIKTNPLTAECHFLDCRLAEWRSTKVRVVRKLREKDRCTNGEHLK